MIRKIMISILGILMIFSLVGCNKQGLAIIDGLKEASMWDAVNQKEEIAVNVKLGENEISFRASIDFYALNKKSQLEGVVQITEIVDNWVNNESRNLPTTLEPLKFYVDGMKVYISNNFMQQVSTILGYKIIDEIEIGEAYIVINMDDGNTNIELINQIFMANSLKALDILGEQEIEVAIKNEEDKYIVDIRDDDIAELIFDYLKRCSDNQLDTYDSNNKELFKDKLKGSNAYFTYYKNNESLYNTLSLKLRNEDKNVDGIIKEGDKILLDNKSSIVKAEVKEIIFPTCSNVYTIQDLTKVPNNNKILKVNKKDIVSIEDKDYMPAKTTLKLVGYTLVYNDDTKQIVIEELGNRVIELKSIDGVSYINFEQLKQLGIKCS